MIIVSNDLFYATPQLERLAHVRDNVAELEKRMKVPTSRFILLHESQNLFFLRDGQSVPAFLSYETAQPFLQDRPNAYLGQSDGIDIFCIDLKEKDKSDVLAAHGDDFFFEDLRRAGPIAERTEASQLAYARALMFWHCRHRYCGFCGSETEMRSAGHVRKCTNPSCGLEHFPRTDPAVIMLVHDGDRCLLGRHSRLKEGMYSTLAGFVEPGETLEQAVTREVQEETGVYVSDVRYAGSQPWPFPTSLMLGFYAKAESTEIKLDDDELDDAQWFTKDELVNFASQGKSLPSKDSIARNLIENWIKGF